MVASIEAAVAAGGAAIAALAAAAALWFAWKALAEARATAQAQRELLTATHQATAALERVVANTDAVAQRTERSVGALNLILAETRASRDLDQLHRIAGQLGEVTIWRRKVRGMGGREAPWHELEDTQRLLGTLLAAFPEGFLLKCSAMARPDAHMASAALDDESGQEIRRAVETARQRLAEAASQAERG